MWVRFTADYDWRPSHSVTIAYKAGWTGNVTRRCGEAAVAAGKAVRMRKVRKGDEPEPVEAPEPADGGVTDGDP